MKYSHFLFLSLFALLSLSSHGFEQEHEHDFHEEESEQQCISCHLLEFSIETNKLDGNFISTNKHFW